MPPVSAAPTSSPSADVDSVTNGDGGNANVTMPSMPLRSDEISVRHFEFALVWPVLIQPQRDENKRFLDPKTDPTRADFLKHWIDTIGRDSCWCEVATSYPPRTGKDAEPGYSEFCYFHPIIRNFLYSNRDDIRAAYPDKLKRKIPLSDDDIRQATNRNLRILKREDLRELVVEYEMQPTLDGCGQSKDETLRSHLQIDLCRLYLFDTQIAMLELKLIHTRTEKVVPDGSILPLNLRVMLRLQDILRRVYAPYWSIEFIDNAATHFAGHCPRRLELIFKGDKPSVVSTFGNFRRPDTNLSALVECAGENDSDSSSRKHRDAVFRNREPYTEEVFRKLLHPITPVQLQPKKSNILLFEQIEDERIPAFSYVAVDDPRRISTGDWIRLASLDDEGDSRCYPYSPLFLGDNPLAGFAYDRFWHPTGKAPAQDTFHSTRWLCSGYGFVGVGQHDPREQVDKWFFSNEHNGALAHFRHHYFALGLIAHFQRASLLRFKHALAEAAGELLESEGAAKDEDERMARFHKKSDRLMREFLRFRTLYWFSEVSNQIQGRELFELSGRHLRLQPLFAEVAADMESAASLLRTWDEENQTDAAQTLAVLGALFLSVTPALEWFGGGLDNKCRSWAAIGLFLILSGILMLFLPIPRTWTNKWVKWLESESIPNWLKCPLRWLERRCSRVSARYVLAIMLLLAGLVSFRLGMCQDLTATSATANPSTAPATVHSEPALPPTTSASSTVIGENDNAEDLAPQKPNSGKEPPNQAAGAAGDRAAKEATNSPEP